MWRCVSISSSWKPANSAAYDAHPSSGTWYPPVSSLSRRSSAPTASCSVKHDRDRILDRATVERRGDGRILGGDDGVEFADHWEEHPLLFGEVRFEIGPNRVEACADLRELGMTATVHRHDLLGQRCESWQLIPEIVVMGGFEVIDELGDAHREPCVARLVGGCTDELVDHRGDVETLGSACVRKRRRATAAVVEASTFELARQRWVQIHDLGQGGLGVERCQGHAARLMDPNDPG